MSSFKCNSLIAIRVRGVKMVHLVLMGSKEIKEKMDFRVRLGLEDTK